MRFIALTTDGDLDTVSTRTRLTRTASPSLTTYLLDKELPFLSGHIDEQDRNGRVVRFRNSLDNNLFRTIHYTDSV